MTNRTASLFVMPDYSRNIVTDDADI